MGSDSFENSSPWLWPTEFKPSTWVTIPPKRQTSQWRAGKITKCPPEDISLEPFVELNPVMSLLGGGREVDHAFKNMWPAFSAWLRVTDQQENIFLRAGSFPLPLASSGCRIPKNGRLADGPFTLCISIGNLGASYSKHVISLALLCGHWQ